MVISFRNMNFLTFYIRSIYRLETIGGVAHGEVIGVVVDGEACGALDVE